jgi:hypothetical protein
MLVVLSSLPAYADDVPPPPTPFDQGRVSLSAGGGTASNFNHQYIVIGGAVGYYVLDGVELSLHGLEQFGDGPNISELSPQLRYVAQPLVGRSPVIPYAGVFYNHWFIGEDYQDINTIGARAGGLLISGSVVFGLGIVFEHVLTPCYADGPHCVAAEDAVYPDITFGFTL